MVRAKAFYEFDRFFPRVGTTCAVFYEFDDCSLVDANDDDVEDLALISKLRI